MPLATLDKQSWTIRLGNALERVAEEARPDGFPFRPQRLPVSGAADLADRKHDREIRQLLAQALGDAHASEILERPTLWLDTVPPEVAAILREHPVLETAWSGSDPSEGFHWTNPMGGGHVDFKFFAANLARSSLKLGGERVATLLHRFLVAGRNTRLHAHEITVLHGLITGGRIELGTGAYLAPYEAAAQRFDLPEDPEPRLAGRIRQLGASGRPPARSVLVRPLGWGPGVARCGCPGGNEYRPNIRYRFPGEHGVDSWDRFFRNHEMLVQLLSVAMESKLVFHVVFHALPSWMRKLDPNFGLLTNGPSSSLFDVWPEDRPVSKESAATFVELARGWLSYPEKQRHGIELAARRIAAAFGPAGGTFGLEDRVLDVAIALEIMYGPFDGGEITHKLRTRAAWLLGTSPHERMSTLQDVKAFYKARSIIVHGGARIDRRVFEEALPLGRDLARRTLFALLTRHPAPDWDKLVVGG
ncbi:MAG: HEPN domain-containing protein [Rhodospirillaceae bacterium]|nr:HEPN domain-containing protein [Rhodospirillaceae bacterium]